MPTAAKSKSSRSSATKSESPVAARAELDAQAAGPEGNQEEQLEQSAKDQEAQQKQELREGKRAGKGAVELETIAEQRSGRQGEKPLFGRVDNMTRRSDAEPLEGHFVHIDYSGDGGKEAATSVATLLGEDALQGREPGVGVADYGVYLQPGQLGEDGYPATAIVMLRDEFAANVVVPYESLRPALAGRR